MFTDEHKNCTIKYIELKQIDENNLPIPLIDKKDWSLLTKLHSINNVISLGKLKSDFIVRRGEINQTVYRKYIQKASTNAERLIKGVQIGQYRFKRKLSQGEVEWFNEKQFLKENNSKEIVNNERIATQRITGVDERLRIVATIVQPKAYFADSTNSLHLNKDSKYNLRYLLALLNSKLFQWRFKLTSTNNNVGTNELEALPIKGINLINSKDKPSYEDLTKHSDLILKLYEELEEEKLPNKIEQLKQRIEHSEDKINQLVYELYELTPEEIKIVEGGINE